MADPKFFYPVTVNRAGVNTVINAPALSNLPVYPIRKDWPPVVLLFTDETGKEGLYLHTERGWWPSLAPLQVSVGIISGYDIVLYTDLIGPVPVPTGALVYKNTYPFTGTELEPGPGLVYAVMTPSFAHQDGTQTTAKNPTWPADFDDPDTGDKYKPGGTSVLATRDLVLEGLSDLVWIQPVNPARTVTVPKEALIKRQIVLTGNAPDERFDVTHPTSVLLPSGGEWGIINLCTGAGPVHLLNDKTFGSSIPLFSGCDAHIATGDTYGIHAVSGDIGGNAYRLAVNQVGGQLNLTDTQLLYHILTIVDNPVNPLQASLTYKFPLNDPAKSGMWTFVNNLAQVNPPSIFVEGSTGGQFEVQQNAAITVVHDANGKLTLVETAVSGFFASGVEIQPKASGTSISIGQQANAVGSADAVAIGDSSTAHGSAVAIGADALGQDFSVAIGKGAEVAGGSLVGYGVAIGYQAKGHEAAINIGWNAVPVNPTDVYIGADIMPTDPSNVVLGGGSKVTTFATPGNHVSVGIDDGTLLRRITGVAPGVNPNDAVVMSQLPTVPTLGTMATQDADNVSITGGSVKGVDINPKVFMTPVGAGSELHDLGGVGGTVQITSASMVYIIDTLGTTAPVVLDFSENFSPAHDGIHIAISFTEGCSLTTQNPHAYIFKGWNPTAVTSIPADGFTVRMMFDASTNTFYRIA
jgi:hypothetical protein